MSTKELIKSEVENYAEFDIIRYAQVWEDADVLLDALDINENDEVLSIASAGENALSLLTRNPKHVYAIDLSDEQIFCCQFKFACYQYLDYKECMELMGVFESNRRKELYSKLKSKIPKKAREYFDDSFYIIENGIIHAGKFEHYLRLFGNKVLPLIHSEKTILELLERKSKSERYDFYYEKWNNRRWRLLFKIFFSRHVMAKLGRDEAFFRYVNVNVAENILNRTKYAITELDTSKNSYLHYIIKGKYEDVLPVAYRKENFEIIKNNINRISLHSEPIEKFISSKDIWITKYNLSDIFEYMSDEEMCKIFDKIIEESPPGAKIAYWNMLADKRASKYLKNLDYKEKESQKLLNKDKAFFYSNFILEEIIK